MNVNDFFPSKWLKHNDLPDQDLTLTISEVGSELVGTDQSRMAVVYFKGAQKGLLLNKTNAERITELYGPEMDNWAGNQITLYVDHEVPYAGKTVSGIRVRRSIPAAPAVPAVPVAPPQPGHGPITEDDIPF